MALVGFFVGLIFHVLSRLKKIFFWAYHGMLKSSLKSCGKNVFFGGWIRITCPEKVDIGDNVAIGNNAFIDSVGGLRIGNNSRIAPNVVIYTYNHNYEGDMLPYDEKHIPRGVEIGKNVWIGTNVKITPGVRIGVGAIVGMGTVVNADVPPLAIVGGQKMRIIKYRDKKHYNELEKKGRYLPTEANLLERKKWIQVNEKR